MAGKKKPSVENQIIIFKDIIKRMTGKDLNDINFIHINRIIITTIEIKNKKYYILINIEALLWNKLLDDNEFHITEMDINDISNKSLLSKITLITDSKNQWISINETELYNGKIIKIRPENYEYDIKINKNLLPVKLKKSEYNNILYSITYNGKYFILSLKKEFKYEIEDCGFDIIRLFQIM